MTSSCLKRVYVMESGLGLIKLGISQDPEKRGRTIQGATSIPIEVVHTTELTTDAKKIEFIAHRLLAEKRRAGEWFDVSPKEAVAAIRTAVEELEVRRNAKRRRGRPSTGRKLVAQIPLDHEDIYAVRTYAEREDRTVADVLRDLIKGVLKWKDVIK